MFSRSRLLTQFFHDYFCLRGDARWKYGVPPANNANFAWVQHFLYHYEVEDEETFHERMEALTRELAAQMKEAAELDLEIKIQLAKVGFEL